MNNLRKIVLDYFTPPPGHFWKWCDNGEAVEWRLQGETICYTADLMNVLRGLTDIGLPPLGTVLILLAACQEREDSTKLDSYIRMLSEVSKTQFGRAFRIHPLARTMLRQVQTLPSDLRTGNSRIHLIREILDTEATKSRATQVPPELVQAVLDEFSSGRTDRSVFQERRESGKQFLLIEIIPLAFACRKFPEPNSLEEHLRTGLPAPPVPAELPLPEPGPIDLLDELEDDPKTMGLARLARRMLAALNIPMHARGASDLPIGGVADISNRGDFDRLLLSELAHDDLTLTARLVNNEALFLRREEPPANLDRQRTILVDTTLKMWGVQRVFALSTALGFARNSRHVTAIRAFALGGSRHEEIDLKSKAGVMAALEQLDSALHCGNALGQFFAKAPRTDNEDYVLISDAEAMRDESFQAAFSEIRQRLRFLVTLHRDGSLEFFEFVQGRGKLIGKPKFDLDALLFAPPKSSQKPALLAGPRQWPAFFQRVPPPLFFPLTAVRMTRQNTCFDKDFGVVVVTDHQRVLHWPKDRSGALELAPFIESGQYVIGFSKYGEIFILVHHTVGGALYLYHFNGPGNVAKTDFPEGFAGASAVAYDQGKFYIQISKDIQMIDAATGQKAGVFLEPDPIFGYYQRRLARINFYDIKQFIRHTYSTIQRVKSIYITSFGELCVDNHYLRLLDQDHLKWDAGAVAESRNVDAGALPENAQSLLYERTWPNGSRAIADSRGFLHLIPAGKDLPEVTIVLIANAMTAAWASNSATCGSNLFINDPTSKHLPAAEFYDKYIKSFIDQCGQ